MAIAGNDLFYTRLPVNEIPLAELLTEEHLFFRLPVNWHVLITDVKKSTEAVAGGRHETVNVVATGCIVAVLNIAYRADLTLPFFFGGDGATFIVPSSILEPCRNALQLHRENTFKNFGLELRVGQVPVEDIYSAGHDLKVTKLRASSLFAIPVMLGEGLSFAEKKIKAEDYNPEFAPEPGSELDLSGMECRWDRIKPPESQDEVISLLVVTRDATRQAGILRRVVEAIDRIYGEQEKRKPITESRLRLKATLEKLGREMRTKYGGVRPLYLLQKLITSTLGPFYFKTRKGKKYLNQLVQLSDTLVIDGRLNTVISGTARQREELVKTLDLLEQEGDIYYGFFVSRESVLSCYVRNMNEKHIHFVDGSDGGYTRAAGMLKKKFAAG